MPELTFHNIENRSSFHIHQLRNIEYGNPIEFWGENFIEQTIGKMKQRMSYETGYEDVSEAIKEKVITRLALKDWKDYYEDILQTQLNKNLVQLISTTKKAEQIKLLKGLYLSSDDLMPLFFYAYNELGYTFSNYTFLHFKGVSQKDMPKMAYIEEDGELTVIGQTILMPEQIRQAIKSQHRLIVRILDKGDTWHCFFQTMKGITGNEKGNQPHIHYISNSFNLSRMEVINQFKKEKYSLPSIPHINFERHS